MTISESSQHMLKWFSKYDSFNLDEDFKILFPNHTSTTLEADKASIILSLEDYINIGILRKSSIKGKDYYVLIRPLTSLTQTLTLSNTTCSLINLLMQIVIEKSKNKDINFNPLQITDVDILTLLSVLTSEIKNMSDIKSESKGKK